MAVTTIGLGDAKAAQKWSGMLAVDTAKTSYFSTRFMGTGPNASAPITVLTELEASAGDQIHYDVSMQISAPSVEGDDLLEGNEQALSFFSDALYIDQSRQAVNCGGRMSNQRTLHNLRAVAQKRLSDYWARLFDETLFCYLSGSRGVNSDFINPTTWTGRANNSLVAPDSEHLVYGGNATAKNDLDSGDGITLGLVDTLVAKAKTLPSMPLQPVTVDGADHYVFVMSPWQEYSMRTATGESSWLSVQKAAAGAEGRNNPIFKGSLGLYAGVVLHSNGRVVQFSDYGSGANVKAARALFLGHQAATMAFGSTNGRMRFDWVEDTADLKSQIVVATHSVWGVKKTRFNSKDFGVISVDAYDPRG